MKKCEFSTFSNWFVLQKKPKKNIVEIFIFITVMALLSFSLFSSSISVEKKIAQLGSESSNDLYTIVSPSAFSGEDMKFAELLISESHSIIDLRNNFVQYGITFYNGTTSRDFTLFGLSEDFLLDLGISNNLYYSISASNIGDFQVSDEFVSLSNGTMISQIDEFKEMLGVWYRINGFIFQESSYNIIVTSLTNSYKLFEKAQLSVEADLSVGFISNFGSNWWEGRTTDEIYHEIDSRKRKIFNFLVSKDILLDFDPVKFFSPLESGLKYYEKNLKEQLVLLQVLNIPNFIFIIVLITLSTRSAFFESEELRKLLLSRGFTNKSYRIYLVVNKLINLLISYVCMFSASLIMIVTLNLFLSLLINLFVNYIVAGILLIVVNVREITNDEKISETKREILFDKILAPLTMVVLIIALSSLLFVLLSPPLSGIKYAFSANMEVIYLPALLISFLYILRQKNIHTSNELGLDNLVQRLYVNGLSKMHVQKILTIFLFSLIIFFVNAQTMSNTWGSQTMSGDQTKFEDITISTPGFDEFIDLNISQKLMEEVNEIDQILTSSIGTSEITIFGIAYSSQVQFVPPEFYKNDENYGWDHFYSTLNSVSNPATVLDNSSVLINAVLARKLGLAVGDTLSAKIKTDVTLEDNNALQIEVNDLQVVGIFDRFPVIGGYTSETLPYLILDISLVYSAMKSQSIQLGSEFIAIDVKEEYESDLEYVEKSILDVLGAYASRVDIRTRSFTDEDNSYLGFILSNLIFLFVVFPLFTFLFTRDAILDIRNELTKLGQRGISDQYIRGKYMRYIFRINNEVMILGSLIGMIFSLSFARFYLPFLLFASYAPLQLSVLGSVIILNILLFFTNVLVYSLVRKMIKTVLDDKKKFIAQYFKGK